MADDYMSDLFLETLPEVRPGLAFGAGKRKLTAHKRHIAALQEEKVKVKEKKQSAKDVLVKGLQQNVISEDNPGFKMMKMMGYKTGSGLGKQGEGRAEPVKIDPFKDGKSGLGKESQEMEKARKRLKFEQAKLAAYRKNEAMLLAQFRQSKKEEAEHKQLSNWVHKCQTVCSQLDQLHCIQPPEHWYWPKSPSDEEDDEQCEPPVEEMLPQLNSYLRYAHCYCLWCGVKYTDTEDLAAHCPGDTHLAHSENNLVEDTDFAD